MDKSVIPAGCYCYDEKGKCPYWSKVNNLPEQENGYCSYLGYNDYDRNTDIGEIKWEGQHGPVYTAPHDIPISLLWDQVKQCGINDDEDLNYA
jgi:hypothetical protein